MVRLAASPPVVPPAEARQPISDWLSDRARESPDRTALVVGRRSWTFAALDAQASEYARRLASAGAAAGGRVATLLHDGLAGAVLPHAVLRLGATLVPLNVRSSAAEIAWQLGDAQPELLVVDDRTAARVEELLGAKGGPAIVTVATDARVAGIATLGSQRLADVPLRRVHERDAVLAIIYTSGTTGRPKGAMLTVGNFQSSAAASAATLGTGPDDRWLAMLPLFHVGGLSILIRCAIGGMTAVVHEGFDAKAANDAIDAQEVTIVSAVAVMLQRMLDERGDRRYPPSLRCVLLGGGPVPRALLERAVAAGVPVAPTYGLTEAASQVATLAPKDLSARPGSAGRPLPGNEVRIVADDGVDVGAGVPGGILVRGPVVMAGYAGQEDATRRAIVNGWLHTGDVGYLDADGYLYVLDRRDDLIVSGGENVYPAEVEGALLAHPSVAEAGAIGVPDERWGRRVAAVVRLTDGASISVELLRAHCRSLLGGYKVPSEIHVVRDPLPRTASGKLRRSALAALDVFTSNRRTT